MNGHPRDASETTVTKFGLYVLGMKNSKCFKSAANEVEDRLKNDLRKSSSPASIKMFDSCTIAIAALDLEMKICLDTSSPPRHRKRSYT